MRSKLMLSFADEWRRRQVLVRRAAWSVPLLAMLLVVFVTVVLGGRLRHSAHQPCGVTWPFQQIGRKIAAMLTQDKGRSLIIHVGDFHYREKPCLDDDRGCGRSPYGDNWDAWKAEFFDPAKKLML